MFVLIRLLSHSFTARVRCACVNFTRRAFSPSLHRTHRVAEPPLKSILSTVIRARSAPLSLPYIVNLIASLLIGCRYGVRLSVRPRRLSAGELQVEYEIEIAHCTMSSVACRLLMHLLKLLLNPRHTSI